MNLLIKVAVLASFLQLTACVSLPQYKAPSTNDPGIAILDLSRIPSGSICSAGVLYSFNNSREKELAVTTTGRIGISSYVQMADYQVTYSCYPGVSFKPEAGKRYLLNLEIEDQRCRLEIYEKGAKNRTSLALVPDLGPPQYCK